VLGRRGTVVLLHFFLKYTLRGRAMRACSSNPRRRHAREASNIPNTAHALVSVLSRCARQRWGLFVISPNTMTHYEMGAPLAIRGIRRGHPPAGMGIPMGAVAGGFAGRHSGAFAVRHGCPPPHDVAAFVVLLRVLFVRPHGLFGRPAGKA